VIVWPLVFVVSSLLLPDEHPASSATVAAATVMAANAVRDFIIATPL
jgi:hypothetical protein